MPYSVKEELEKRIWYNIINILILFNVCYWGLYFLINLFYDIGKLELLIAYLVIGLILGLFTTREKGSSTVKKWNKLMNQLDSKNNPPKYVIVLIRMIGWPVSIIVTIKNSLKK